MVHFPQDAVVAVSACLLGEKVRYDGGHKRNAKVIDTIPNPKPFCPEVAGGLSTPRAPARIVSHSGKGGNGQDVLEGRARVLTRSKKDVTDEFVRGAQKFLEFCQSNGVTHAVLKQGSPSCGSNREDARAGKKSPKFGVATALLRAHGIRVISEEELVRG